MNDVPNVSPAVNIVALLIYAIAILSACLRLVYRYKRAQLYWDDFWAFVALFCAMFLVAVLISVAVVDMETISVRSQSFLRWALYPLNSVGVWASRLSIGVTVLRILPPGRPRNITLFGNCVMFLMWIGILFENIFFCGSPVPLLPTCETARTTFPIASITINFVASLFLVVWPAYILISHRWRLVRINKLSVPSIHHHLLLACFSTNILLFAADLVHYLAFIHPNIQYRRATGHIEVGVSVFLCNILVLVTSAYRFFVDRDSRTSNDVSLSTMRGLSTNSQVQKVHIIQETHTYTVVSGPDGRISVKGPRDSLVDGGAPQLGSKDTEADSVHSDKKQVGGEASPVFSDHGMKN